MFFPCVCVHVRVYWFGLKILYFASFHIFAWHICTHGRNNRDMIYIFFSWPIRKYIVRGDECHVYLFAVSFFLLARTSPPAEKNNKSSGSSFSCLFLKKQEIISIKNRTLSSFIHSFIREFRLLLLLCVCCVEEVGKREKERFLFLFQEQSWEKKKIFFLFIYLDLDLMCFYTLDATCSRILKIFAPELLFLFIILLWSSLCIF